MKTVKRNIPKKLLMVSRILDSKDPVGSFTQQWAKKIVSKVECLYFICLEAYNVTIDDQNFKYFSMGKEKGYGRLRLLLNYYKYLFKLMKDVDVFFGHMNSMYTVLAVPVAWIYRVRVISWVAFGPGANFMIRLNALLSDWMVTATEDSLEINSKKKKVVGHGIDVSTFRPFSDNKREKKIITHGRLSEIKNQKTLLRACSHISDTMRKRRWKIEIFGRAPTEKSRNYKAGLKKLAEDLSISDLVTFKDPVSNYEVPEILNKSSIFVDMTSVGGAGKSVLESMATETITVLCTDTFNDHLGEELTEALIYRPKDPKDLAEKLKNLIDLIESDRNRAAEIGRDLRDIVVKHHNLDTLMEKILSLY